MIIDDGILRKDASDFSMGGYTYAFDEPPMMNFMPCLNQLGYCVLCRYFAPFFLGLGKTESIAEYDWNVNFHYFYYRMKKLDNIDPNLKELFEKSINSDIYTSSMPIIVEKTGVVVETRLPDGLPSVLRWDDSSDNAAVPDYKFVNKDLLLYKKGERITALVEYNNKTYKLKNILYVEKAAQ